MIVLAYDHGAYETFQKIKEYLSEKNLKYIECASEEYDSIDSFVHYGNLANKMVLEGCIGIYGCRSGIGMSIVSNRHKGIRGALCFDVKVAEMARKHNNANVCILPCDYISLDTALSTIDAFLNTDFLGGKYQERMDEIDK